MVLGLQTYYFAIIVDLDPPIGKIHKTCIDSTIELKVTKHYWKEKSLVAHTVLVKEVIH